MILLISPSSSFGCRGCGATLATLDNGPACAPCLATGYARESVCLTESCGVVVTSPDGTIAEFDSADGEGMARMVSDMEAWEPYLSTTYGMPLSRVLPALARTELDRAIAECETPWDGL